MFFAKRKSKYKSSVSFDDPRYHRWLVQTCLVTARLVGHLLTPAEN